MSSEQGTPTLSVVIPFFDEAGNVDPTVDEVHDALAESPWPWELVLVDDGSRDTTLQQLQEAQTRHGDHVAVLALQRNFGQTAAIQAGIDAAKGTVVVTLDGDTQNDPTDIPRLVRRLLDDDLDLVVGWRKHRKDGVLLRRLPSWLANRIIGGVTGVRLHDYGCGLKAYRSGPLKEIRLYGEMHRFVPAWLAAVTSPDRITEMEVNHRRRRTGFSKYGISRTFRVVLDLVSVFFFLRFWARPGHFFGAIGLWLGAIGGAILGYLGWVKFALGESIGTRPLLLVGVVLVLGSLQFLTTGVVAELLTRVYFESSRVRPYLVKRRSSHEAQRWLDPASSAASGRERNGGP